MVIGDPPPHWAMTMSASQGRQVWSANSEFSDSRGKLVTSDGRNGAMMDNNHNEGTVKSSIIKFIAAPGFVPMSDVFFIIFFYQDF